MGKNWQRFQPSSLTYTIVQWYEHSVNMRTRYTEDKIYYGKIITKIETVKIGSEENILAFESLTLSVFV